MPKVTQKFEKILHREFFFSSFFSFVSVKFGFRFGFLHNSFFRKPQRQTEKNPTFIAQLL